VVRSNTSKSVQDNKTTGGIHTPSTMPFKKNQKRNSERISAEDVVAFIEKNLSDQKSFMRECEVEPSSEHFGSLLVDTQPFKYSYDFWEQILMTRARVHKDAGVMAVWAGMRARNIDIPVNGAQADKFWQIFIRTGLHNQDFLELVWLYVQDLYSRKQGRKYKKLYEILVGGFMIRDPATALQWHHKLKSVYWTRDSAAFFHRYLSKTHLLPTLAAIYTSIKESQLYHVMIPCLSLRGQFPAAQRWHKLLLRHKDLPEDSSKADLLVAYLVEHRTLMGLKKLLSGFSEQNVPLVASTLFVLINHRSRIKEVITIIKKFNWSLDPGTDDGVWSLLTSYKEVSLEEVQELMQHFGIHKVDQKTASAITLRQTTVQDFLAGAKILKTMNLALNASISSRLVHEAVKLNVDKWHPHVIDNMMGTDFTEYQLREALLLSYLTQQKWKSFDKTYLSLPYKTGKAWNYLLQSCIMRGFTKSTLNILERMRMLGIPLADITASLLFKTTLPLRGRGRRPPASSLHKTSECLKILKKILDGGGEVKAIFWQEMFKRLGMSKQFHALESLSFWLVERYKAFSNVASHNVASEACTMCRETVGHACTKNNHVFGCVSPHQAAHLLDKIFSKNLIRAIIAWGFLDTRPFSWSPMYISQQAHIDQLAESDCTWRMSWGIYLVRALQANGVHVDNRSVVREVRLRLRSLFGIERSERPSVRRAKRETTMVPEEIVHLANRSWGSKLMPDLDKTDEYSLQEYIGWRKKLTPSAIRRARRLQSLRRTSGHHSLALVWASSQS